jgi:hypothetical protein
VLRLREGARVERCDFQSLAEALEGLEARLRELLPRAQRKEISVLRRSFEPVRQVVARGEISGPGAGGRRIHGGIDLRGDGSLEAYVGRLRRSLVALQPGESPYDGLHRALRGSQRD